MSADDITRKLEEHLYASLYNQLPRGLDYAGPDDSEELVMTDGSGEYHVEIIVDVWQPSLRPGRTALPSKVATVETEGGSALTGQGETDGPMFTVPLSALIEIDPDDDGVFWCCALTTNPCGADGKAPDHAAAVQAATEHLASVHGIRPVGTDDERPVIK